MPPYNSGAKLAADLNLAATSFELRMMLVTTGYTYNADHALVDDGTTSDPLSYEIGVSGYARQDLSSRATYQDDAGDFAGLDASDVTFSSLGAGATIGSAVIFRYSTASTTSDTGQTLLGEYPFTTATATNGGDITVQFAATSDGSVLRLQSTST